MGIIGGHMGQTHTLVCEWTQPQIRMERDLNLQPFSHWTTRSTSREASSTEALTYEVGPRGFVSTYAVVDEAHQPFK